MPEGWEWDDTLFLGSAPYYRRGRLPYAPGLVDALAEALTLDGRGRLIDVGCGPGTLALSLAHLFREAVGVDPDRGMLAEAERQAAATGLAGRTRWLRARAEELPADLGSFTVATFGNSFHWMDRDTVAATVKGMLPSGGAFVQVSDLKTADLKTADPKTADPKTADPNVEPRSEQGFRWPGVPHPAIAELTGRYLGAERRAGRGVLRHGTPGDEAAVLARAGFAGPQRLVVPGGQLLERAADDVVAWVFSLSFSAPHLFGERRAAFEADLRRLLREVSPTDRFSERLPSTEAFVWRKP